LVLPSIRDKRVYLNVFLCFQPQGGQVKTEMIAHTVVVIVVKADVVEVHMVDETLAGDLVAKMDVNVMLTEEDVDQVPLVEDTQMPTLLVLQLAVDLTVALKVRELLGVILGELSSLAVMARLQLLLFNDCMHS